jgi:hypothetical protein
VEAAAHHAAKAGVKRHENRKRWRETNSNMAGIENSAKNARYAAFKEIMRDGALAGGAIMSGSGKTAADSARAAVGVSWRRRMWWRHSRGLGVRRRAAAAPGNSKQQYHRQSTRLF